MSYNPRAEIPSYNYELDRMVRDMDELHYDVSVPAMAEAGAGMSLALHDQARAEEGFTSRRVGRRTFILGAGAAVGGLALAACSSSPSSTTSPTTAASPSPGSVNPSKPPINVPGDLAVTALATSLEVQAVNTYNAAVTAVLGDKFGNIPPAATNFALVARTQHQQHADAWNNILTAAGKSKVTTGPSQGTYSDDVVNSMFGTIAKNKDLVALLELALVLEDQAAQTYQMGSFTVVTPQGIMLAASIQPVEMQHVAILYFVLGKYPGAQDSSGNPVSFHSTSNAVPTGDYTGTI